MSRTTTVDGAPASDTDKQSISQPNQFIKRGTPQFMRVTLALFSAGLATFALLYCVQPILPVLSQEFGLTPANSSISPAQSANPLQILTELAAWVWLGGCAVLILFLLAHLSPYKKQPKSQVKLINDSEAISNATYPALLARRKSAAIIREFEL